MWYTGGFSVAGIGYAETTDLTGKTGWSKYSGNPVITGHYRGDIVHSGSTFYEFTVNQSTNAMDLYTSADTDGLTWTLNTSGIIPLGTTGQFDAASVENSTVLLDTGGGWDMIYEGKDASGNFACGAATAATLTGTWTKSASNPVIGLPGCSGPWLAQIGSNYWVWAGAAIQSASQGFARWTATSLNGPWTLNPARGTFYDGATFQAASSDEAPAPGGIADQYQIQISGSTYRYYAATNIENSAAGDSHIKLAIAALPITTLPNTIEGMTSPTP